MHALAQLLLAALTIITEDWPPPPIAYGACNIAAYCRDAAALPAGNGS